MKVYEYNEIQGYNNVDEIMREKTIVFGSINEGKIVKIFYKNSSIFAQIPFKSIPTAALWADCRS